MTKKEVLNGLRTVFKNLPELSEKLFLSNDLPKDYEKYIFTISSLDFVDLLINLETILNIEIDEVLTPLLTIEELANRIAYHEK